MTVIRNGLVIDGTSAPARRADVLLSDDRIVDIVEPSSAGYGDAISYDAAGALVTPGFIDAHAHSDAYLVLEPAAPSKISQGITTEVNGQCGGSIAPRYGEARLSSDWASLLGARLTWRSLAEYRTVLEAARPAVNTVQFIGHNTLRSSVVGYAPRAATADEVAQMSRLLAESLDAGGWGLTTGLIYQPGRYATADEVTALARVAAAKGGLYATHMRSEGDEILAALDEVAALARTTGIRVEISHLKTSGAANWSKIDAVLEKMESAIAEGIFLGSDRYPYCAAGTDLDIVLPDWAQAGAAKAECVRLADAATRARLIREIDAEPRDWQAVMIGGTWSEKTRRLSGRTIADILAAGELPVRTAGELVCFILAEDRCRTGAFFFGMCEENLAKIYARPWIVPGSDASLRAPWGPLAADHPHPRAYATMSEFYRRVRALGFTREETIARMTSVPAKRFGLVRRGELRAGAYADICVWDEARFRARATYDAPHQFTEGVRAVFVNGVLTYESGRFTEKRAGRFLTRTL